MEEPPAKITKFEMESQYLEGEVMEEGQEEWLSEGILTDDDYNPASQQTELDCSDSNVGSQDETINTVSTEGGQSQLDNSTQNMDSNVSNIEETLNNLENSQTYTQTSDLPEELNAFLIRKMDGKIIGSELLKKESDVDESVKQSDDDGNDTDDLLRVLGDGDQSSQQIKKEKCEMKVEHGNSSDEDDNFIFGGDAQKVGDLYERTKNGGSLMKLKNLNVAKTVLNRAPATKAEPEDDDPTDCSSDEAGPVKTIFTLNKGSSASTVTPQISTTVKPGNFTITPLRTNNDQPKKKIIKRVYDVTDRGPRKVVMRSEPIEVKRPPNSTRRTYVNKRVTQQGTSLLKSNANEKKKQPDEVIDEQEFMEDGNIELDEDFTQKPKEEKENKSSQQRLMCPEVMDEDVPTDAESNSDEESLYSELPSSDSDVEDWFKLDIRAERAGDYLPLLGDRAHQLLSEERCRVKTRLDTLKKSLAALSDSGRDLAEQLREATNTVAELDALLKVV